MGLQHQLQASARALPPLDERNAFVGFVERRTYAARRSPKTAAARAKELHLNKADPARRTKMLEARAKEWSNWVGFDATTVLSPEQAKQFLRDNPDTEVVPTRWVDTLKSQPWEEDRRKARMVVRGDHTLAFAASRRQPVQGGDITAAFLQGETITRQLVLALSKDGVEGVEEGSLLVANKPVYGTRDAPRGFWKKLDKVVKKHGLRSVRFEPGAYVLVGPEHRVLGPMVSHVDDLLWTGSPEMNAVMDKVQQDLRFGSGVHRRLHLLWKAYLPRGDRHQR